MSYCQKCGKSYEDNKFKCSYCGAPLVYAPPSTEGPTFFDKLMRYKSFLALIVIAIIISMIGVVAQVVDMIFWVVLAGIAAVILFLVIKQKKGSTGSNPRDGGQMHRQIRHKPSNVIPLNKKRNNKDDRNKTTRN